MNYINRSDARHSFSKQCSNPNRKEVLEGGWQALVGLGVLALILCGNGFSQSAPLLQPVADETRPLLMTASLSDASSFLPAAAVSSSAAPAAEAAFVVIAPVAKPVEKPEAPGANPGRPSYSTSAALVPMGYVQTETGIFYAAGSAEFDRRVAPEQTLRLTVAPRVEFILGFEPTAFSTSGRDGSSRRGDLTEGLQVLLANGHGARPALAVGYTRLMKGGSNASLDMGGCAQGLLLIASSDFGKYHMDANVFLNEQTAGPVRRGQLGQFVAVSHPVTSKLGLGAEFRHFTQPFDATRGMALMLAPTYTVRPNLVFDAGVSRGLTSTSTHWQAVAGVTYLLPRRAGRHVVR